MPEHIKRNADEVFYGPWIGEFGWELMTWQAWCREDAKQYKKAYACSYPDMAYLYQDFAEFIPHQHPKRHLDWRNVDDVIYEKPEGAIQIVPFKEYRVQNQHFIAYGMEQWDMQYYEYLIHARGINKGGKNYPREKWEELVKRLNSPLIASVGTGADLHVEGTHDCRGYTLEQLTSLMRNARFVIGQSSGVMHLATLCKTPIIVWGDKRTYFGETLDLRYKKTWNPFGSHVHFIFDDNWSPPPEIIDDILSTMGIPPAMENDILDPVVVQDIFAPDLLPEELSQMLIKATQESKRYLITVSWIEGPNIKHYFKSNNYPDHEYVASLEHLLNDLKKATGFTIKRKHITQTGTKILSATQNGEVPILKDGKLSWL